jgi:hypothetical protein
MPNWVVGVVGTSALSLILASRFLLLRCRGIGPPFGPRAGAWAVLIVVATAIVSTGVGLLVGAASHQLLAVYVGIVVPSGLWFIKLPPQRDRDLLPRTLAALLTLPFSRLYDRMGDDMQDWCDTRIRAASGKPQWIADAVTYYSDQVEGQLKDGRARATLERWRESITHKIGIVRLISLDTTPARLGTVLQMHPSTQHIRKYADDDLQWLADRLESDALNELHLFLAYVYRLGYYKLPSYPYRPPVLRKSRHAVDVLSVESLQIGDYHRQDNIFGGRSLARRYCDLRHSTH